jgi:ribosome-associated translation inhibitor RaiA
MQIQVNTDNFIQGDERLEELVKKEVRDHLGYLEDQLTRVEVHLKDQNGDKRGPENIQCTMEARPKGKQPISAQDDAAIIQSAVTGAAKKLKTRLVREFGKLESRQKEHTSHRP